jgi:hypothetical protein
MNEPTSLTPEELLKEQHKLYMREYMKNRYYKNVEINRAISKTNKYKREHTIDETECKKYGIHLADIIHFRKMIKTVPIEFINEIIQSQTVSAL